MTRISAEQRQANLALEAAHADERAADHQRAQELARMQKRGAGRPRKAREACDQFSTSSQIWTPSRNGAQHSRIGMPGKFEIVKPRRNIESTAHS